MIKKLLFTKNVRTIYTWNKFNTSILSLLFTFCFAGSVSSQVSVVAPNANTSTSNGGTFLTVYSNTARTYQLLIDDSQLTALVGQNITSISFRIPGNSTSAWPPTDTTYPIYDVFLSDSVEPANRVLDFTGNVVGAQTQVRTGPLVIPANALTFGTNPNAFSYKIDFTTPYVYTAGTNLLIELRHSANDTNISRSTEATGTSTAGYGTLFTACWQGTGGVVQGNFAVVQINGETLGVNSVEIDNTFTVYPNPVKDILSIKSDVPISEFNVFNVEGKKIISGKNSKKITQINVAKLPIGNYILQTTDKKGNSRSTKFVKE